MRVNSVNGLSSVWLNFYLCFLLFWGGSYAPLIDKQECVSYTAWVVWESQ